MPAAHVLHVKGVIRLKGRRLGHAKSNLSDAREPLDIVKSELAITDIPLARLGTNHKRCAYPSPEGTSEYLLEKIEHRPFLGPCSRVYTRLSEQTLTPHNNPCQCNFLSTLQGAMQAIRVTPELSSIYAAVIPEQEMMGSARYHSKSRDLTRAGSF